MKVPSILVLTDATSPTYDQNHSKAAVYGWPDRPARGTSTLVMVFDDEFWPACVAAIRGER